MAEPPRVIAYDRTRGLSDVTISRGDDGALTFAVPEELYVVRLVRLARSPRFYPPAAFLVLVFTAPRWVPMLHTALTEWRLPYGAALRLLGAWVVGMAAILLMGALLFRGAEEFCAGRAGLRVRFWDGEKGTYTYQTIPPENIESVEARPDYVRVGIREGRLRAGLQLLSHRRTEDIEWVAAEMRQALGLSTAHPLSPVLRGASV